MNARYDCFCKLTDLLDAQESLSEARRHLHRYPELSFQEKSTAQWVADKLQAWGYDVTRNVGGHGLVATLKNGEGKGIALRADMDALPIQEETQKPYASEHTGTMHACGHDGHTAMLLGAAQYLSNHREFKGSIIFIFQPAEEGGAGAQKMIDDGLFEQFPCDAVFGMHNWPGLGEGHFGVTSGPMMASSNAFRIEIQGKGGHAALPHNSADPIMAGVQIAQALQTIITRNKRPVDAAVISITQFHAGKTSNVIPDTAMLGGTVRTFTLEVLDLIERRLHEISNQVAGAFDCKATIEFKRNYPPLINHEKETEFASKVMKELVGEKRVNTRIDPTMGAEDFAFMLLKKPGCYVFLGNGDGDHRTAGHGMGPCHLHNPSYDFNDALIPVGINYWVRLAQTFLA